MDRGANPRATRFRAALAALGIGADRGAADRLGAALDHATAELARVTAARAESDRAAAAAALAAERARARILEGRAAEATLHRALEAAAAEAARLRTALSDSAQQLEAAQLATARLLASTSWRITAPLRRITTGTPAPLRRLAGRLLRRPARLRTPEPAAPPVPPDPYAEWIAANEPFELPPAGALPEIAVLMPGAGHGMQPGLAALLAQEAGWTLLAPDLPAVRDATAALRHDRRLHLVSCAPELDRGGVLAALLDQVRAPWFAVLDEGDILAPGALQTLARALAADPGAAAAISEEDEIDAAGRRSNPRFKPGWSPDLLQASDYFGRLAALSSALARAAGGFRADTGTEAEWDLHRRLTAHARTHPVHHLPAILCHRPPGAVRDAPTPDPHVMAGPVPAIHAVPSRPGGDSNDVVATRPPDTNGPHLPPVSVILPDGGDLDLLRHALAAVLEHTDYPGIDLILAATGRDDPAATALHAELRRVEGLRIAEAPGPRSVFAALDAGARLARAELLLFLGPAATIQDPSWLRDLVRLAGRPGLAAIGPAAALSNPAALPWDCLLCRRDAYAQAGSFGEGDRDGAFCQRLGALGWRLAGTPAAVDTPPAPVLPAGGPFLFDDAAVIAATGLPRHHSIPAVFAEIPIEDRDQAARWVIALLRTRADLRVRFPRALSDGADGAFAAYLEGSELPLPPGLRERLPALWRSDLAARPRELYAWRDDVRAAHPAGLLPPGMPAFLRYLLCDGSREHALRLEESWWWLLCAAEQPAAELVRAYRFTPEWQRLHPLGLTVFGAAAFAAWIAGRYGTGGTTAWLDPATWPGLPAPAEQIRLAYALHSDWPSRHPEALQDPGPLLRDLAQTLPDPARSWCAAHADTAIPPAITIIGHFCYPSGLRVSVESIADALESAGVAVARRDIRTRLEDCADHTRFGGLESAGVTLLHVQPGDLFLKAYDRADLAPRTPRTHRIGYWYWELEDAPPAWAGIARYVDELWVATDFIADALRKTVDVPVHTLFPGVRLAPFTPRPREAFGAPARGNGRFAFLFSFHMASIMERKNPLGLIRAFRRAFSPHEPVDLVLKTTSTPAHAAQLTELHHAAAGANITILDELLDPADTLALMDSCDAYISLHRSEGLGLTMAEAMLLGKPVIATRYSGNLQFMDNGNSLLVDATLVPVGAGNGPYDSGARWAEPSEEHAGRLMRHLVADRSAAVALGRSAQVSAAASLALDAAGIRMARRLLEIGRS